MHVSLVVAEYLLNKAKKNGTALTPMQLVKLVYLCHGWMLGLHERPLIAESVEAWKYGPVIRTIYNAVKHFRSKPVVGPLIKNSRALQDFDDDEKSIMDQVFEIYGEYTGIDLSRLTHTPGSPWWETWDAGETIISNDLIESHFRRLSEQP